MPPRIAAVIFGVGVAGLFWLDRDKEARPSKAILLPLTWLWLSSSRSVAEWMAFAGWGPPLAADGMYAEGSPADRNVLTALMVLGMLVLARRKRIGQLLARNLPVVLFFAYAALSTLWSDFPDIAIRRWFKAIGDFVMVMVIASDPQPTAAFKRVLVSAGFLLIPHSILAIKYYPEIGRSYNRWTYEVSYTGVTTHKNSLGGICEIYGIVFVSSLLAALRDKHRQRRLGHIVAHATALGMAVWLFIQANSVTAQSCFLLATVFIAVTGARSMARKRGLVPVLTTVLIVVPLCALFLGVGSSAIEGMGRDSTLTGRTDIWPRVLALCENKWIGTGFESFWLGRRLEIMQQYQKGLNESHNGYIEILLTLGWVGVALLLILIARAYRNIMRGFEEDHELSRLKAAYFIAIVVSSFTEAAFRTLGVSWILLLMMAVCDRRPAPAAERAFDPYGVYKRPVRHVEPLTSAR